MDSIENTVYLAYEFLAEGRLKKIVVLVKSTGTRSVETLSSFSISILVLAAISTTRKHSAKKFSYSTHISIFDFEIFTNSYFGSTNTVIQT